MLIDSPDIFTNDYFSGIIQGVGRLYPGKIIRGCTQYLRCDKCISKSHRDIANPLYACRTCYDIGFIEIDWIVEMCEEIRNA